MPINRFPAGNLVDVTTLTPFTKDISGVAGTGAFQTVFSVNGEGFLESFYSYQSANNAGFSLRVTADGVVKFLSSQATATRQPLGIVSKLDLLSAATAGQSGFRLPASITMTTIQPSAFKSFPHTDNTEGVVLLGDSKMYFTQSLLLEINCPAAGTYQYHYVGAYR